jgi:hypothetical protein
VFVAPLSICAIHDDHISCHSVQLMGNELLHLRPVCAMHHNMSTTYALP